LLCRCATAWVSATVRWGMDPLNAPNQGMGGVSTVGQSKYTHVSSYLIICYRWAKCGWPHTFAATYTKLDYFATIKNTHRLWHFAWHIIIICCYIVTYLTLA